MEFIKKRLLNINLKKAVPEPLFSFFFVEKKNRNCNYLSLLPGFYA